MPRSPLLFSDPHFLSWSWVLPREASSQPVSGKRKGPPPPASAQQSSSAFPARASAPHAQFPAPWVRAPSLSQTRRKRRPEPCPRRQCPGPCVGRSALDAFIPPSPCPRPELSTRECSGQLPGLDGALRELSTPVPGPAVSSLAAVGDPLLQLPTQCSERQHGALSGGGTSRLGRCRRVAAWRGPRPGWAVPALPPSCSGRAH